MEITPVQIKKDNISLEGDLALSAEACGVVIFAHGSGSSRHSPRNQEVARYLQKEGLATLLFDLLTEKEAQNRENVFDIDLLAKRLVLATKWLVQYLQKILEKSFQKEPLKALPIGYFGASTGAAAALVAAAQLGKKISAVVSRGGRPDLAEGYLDKVISPTLLIVGSRDDVVIGLNQQAAAHLKRAEIVIIPGATHLFEEPGALEQVAKFAGGWFKKYF